MSNILKYLAKYSEESLRSLDFNQIAPFDSILVIPVYNESWELIHSFLNYSSDKRFALVLVFNVPDLEDPSDDQRYSEKCTIRCLNTLRENIGLIKYPDYEFASLDAGNSLYVIDRTINKIPAKQGVGLARKLGLDFALALCKYQEGINGDKVEWIHSSDADVRLPEGYFEVDQQVSSDLNISALIYPFIHKPVQGYEQAISLYEFSLRYYVQNLAQAGSPYAFHTIGSLIVVNAEAYATVRGIPKRAAGEDFYLLNKLAKVGTVHSLECPEIRVAGRPSTRVPFGTGPALNKIKKLDDPVEEYSFYNPHCFELLKILLSIISHAERSFASAEVLFSELRARMNTAESDRVISALKELKIIKQFEHLAEKQCASEFKRAFHTWFDAFVTLRFIHILRDSGYENVKFKDLNSRDASTYRDLV